MSLDELICFCFCTQLLSRAACRERVADVLFLGRGLSRIMFNFATMSMLDPRSGMSDQSRGLPLASPFVSRPDPFSAHAKPLYGPKEPEFPASKRIRPARPAFQSTRL